MKYIGHADDVRQSSDKVGVLLVNLGTPERPVCPGLRDYLSEFLMDPRVIEIPKLLRFILVKGIIINFRAHKSARTYRKIWTDEGSPLLVNSQKLSDGVAHQLGDKYRVELAMRYGNPSVQDKLEVLRQHGVRELVIVPLYPQYSGSTNGSTFDAVADALKRCRWVPKMHFVDSYYRNHQYIEALAQSVQRHWQQHGQAQKLVLSFHGIPEKYVTQGDPYQQQCIETAEALASRLQLNPAQWQLVFQSRFGAQEWLQPYCDKTLESLPGEGVKSVDMICPGFSADCLETLEEIDMENREIFLEAGGESYSYIPCLNDDPAHVDLLSDVVRQVSSQG